MVSSFAEDYSENLVTTLDSRSFDAIDNLLSLNLAESTRLRLLARRVDMYSAKQALCTLLKASYKGELFKRLGL